MTSRFLVPLALGFVVLNDTSVMAQPRGEPQAARYGWVSSLTQGQAQARKNGKPLMVVVRCVP
jgi:hypothetical protein